MDFSRMLEDAWSRRALVAVYTDSNDLDVFSAGFVRDVTATHVSMLSLSAHGEEDGVIARRMADIVRVEVGSRYLQQLRLLHENRGKIFHPWGEDRVASRNDCIAAELQRAHDRRLVVTVQLGPDAEQKPLCGFVSECDDNVVTIAALTRYGDNDGVWTVKVSDIHRLNSDTQEEQVLAFLHGHGNAATR